jgi:hypothetical protein
MAHPYTHDPDLQGDFPFLEFLQEDPQLAYLSAMPEGLRGGQKRFAQSQFQNMLSQFGTALGRQTRAGEFPALQFTNPDFGFTPERIRQQLFSFSPSQRGFGTARFAPPVEFQF